MSDRDTARQTARRSDSLNDWATYRKMRNDCSKALKVRKNDYYKQIFDTFSEEKDTRNIYRTAKKIMGWSAPRQPNIFLVKGIIEN